jgi:hypothetical protein
LALSGLDLDAHAAPEKAADDLKRWELEQQKTYQSWADVPDAVQIALALTPGLLLMSVWLHIYVYHPQLAAVLDHEAIPAGLALGAGTYLYRKMK